MVPNNTIICSLLGGAINLEDGDYDGDLLAFSQDCLCQCPFRFCRLVLPCFSIGYRPPRPRGQVRYPRLGQFVGRCGDRGLERPDAPCDT
eukprot:3363946-Amphidinium_carterae.1